MKKIIVLVLSFGLTSCDGIPSDPMMAFCFKAARASLLSPEKTKLISAEKTITMIDLVVETQNRFGATVRADVVCFFDPQTKDGKYWLNAKLIAINKRDLNPDQLNRANRVARGQPIL
jgi:hypothetical protein